MFSSLFRNNTSNENTKESKYEIEKQTRTLPTIIFADENHQSPYLYHVMKQLLPTLKKMGYADCYGETPSGKSSEQLIKTADDNLKQVEGLIQAMREIKPDIGELLKKMIESENVLSKYNIQSFFSYDSFMTDLHKKAQSYEGTLKYTAILMLVVCLEHDRHNITSIKIKPACVLNNIINKFIEDFCVEYSNIVANDIVKPKINLLQALPEYGFEYRGVDDKNIKSNLEIMSDRSLPSLVNFFNKAQDLNSRNNIMIDAYLDSNKPFIAFTGLAHISGMQQLLSSKIPADIAQANFKFIYIYHKKKDDEIFPEVNEIRQQYRDKNIDLPLGLTLIDARDKSEEEIMSEVVKCIEQYAIEYQSLPENLKEIPDLSFTAQLNRQLSSWYGFFDESFNSAKESITRVLTNVTAEDNSENKPQLK